jgi:hypothetical protein
MTFLRRNHPIKYSRRMFRYHDKAQSYQKSTQIAPKSSLLVLSHTQYPCHYEIHSLFEKFSRQVYYSFYLFACNYILMLSSLNIHKDLPAFTAPHSSSTSIHRARQICSFLNYCEYFHFHLMPRLMKPHQSKIVH